MLIRSEKILDLLTTAIREGDMLDLDDQMVDELLATIKSARGRDNDEIGLSIDPDGAVFYGTRRVHVPPKPTCILQQILADGSATTAFLERTAKTNRVKKVVHELNAALTDNNVPLSVAYDRVKQVYEIF